MGSTLLYRKSVYYAWLTTTIYSIYIKSKENIILTVIASYYNQKKGVII